MVENNRYDQMQCRKWSATTVSKCAVLGSVETHLVYGDVINFVKLSAEYTILFPVTGTKTIKKIDQETPEYNQNNRYFF